MTSAALCVSTTRALLYIEKSDTEKISMSLFVSGDLLV